MKRATNIIVKRAIDFPNTYYGIPLALFAATDPENQLTIIGAGYQDDIDLYQLGDANIAVLAINPYLEYMSLELFNSEYNSLGNIYLKGDDYTRLADLSTTQQINELLEYIL